MIVKSLNNNLVLAVDDKKEELVLFGKGIGFKKRKGDRVEEQLIGKVFHAQGDPSFSHIIESISPEILTVTEKIIDETESSLGQKLNNSILISLADHLQGAVEREQKGVSLSENSLQWEIPFLYFPEHELGKRALEMIQQNLGIQLPDFEASFIALHFINAQDSTSSMDETILITKITKSIVKVIQSLFDISLNKESIFYSRIVTHIRYFINRQLHNEGEKIIVNEQLYQIIQEQYPKSYACGLMI
ncbi:MAG: PRD domain-containing protein [Vagococcus sp.]